MSHGLSRAGVPTDRHAGPEDLAFEAVKRISEKQVVKLGLSRAIFVWKPCLKCLCHVVWMTVLPVLMHFVLVWLLSPVEAVEWLRLWLCFTQSQNLTPFPCGWRWLQTSVPSPLCSLYHKTIRPCTKWFSIAAFLGVVYWNNLKILHLVFYVPRKNRFNLFWFLAKCWFAKRPFPEFPHWLALRSLISHWPLQAVFSPCLKGNTVIFFLK